MFLVQCRYSRVGFIGQNSELFCLFIGPFAIVTRVAPLPARGVRQACKNARALSQASSLAGMISFQPRNHVVDEARRAAVRRVADWVEQALPEEERNTTHVMVNQVECREEGCPPMECVIALLRKPKIIFRVRPRHTCIAMSCCPRPCPRGIHTPRRSLSARSSPGMLCCGLRSSSNPWRR